jgi:hypothetical protein
MKLDLEIGERPMSFSFNEDRNIFLSLPNNIDLSFTLNARLGNSELDFRGLKLSYLNIKGGVGNIFIFLTESSLTVEIDEVLENIIIYIPEKAVLDLRTESGIGKFSIESNVSLF